MDSMSPINTINLHRHCTPVELKDTFRRDFTFYRRDFAFTRRDFEFNTVLEYVQPMKKTWMNGRSRDMKTVSHDARSADPD